MSQSNPQPNLTVYMASAGSGKTFTLAVEYITLLIKNPDNYRYTLAVTFTNKATEEMKTRILSQLYAIMKELKGCQDIIAEIQKRVPEELRNPDLIRKRATIALKNMLNDYSNFRIETIDSFFQTVLRNLAHELHLTASLTVGLNDDEVHAQAVDNVIESIQDERLPKTDRDALLQWIMDFVEEQIRNNKNWNVIGGIKDFSRNLSREFYQKNAESLKKTSSPDNIRRVLAQLRALYSKEEKKKIDGKMEEYAHRFEQLKEQYNIKNDHFAGKSRNPAISYFDKLTKGWEVYSGTQNSTPFPSNKMIEQINDDENEEKPALITTKKKKGEEEILNPETVTDFETNVRNLMKEAEHERKKAVCKCVTAELAAKHLSELGLLDRIKHEVDRINGEANNFPLSQTQKLLSDLINRDSDAPFIYEKIGGVIRYIMIDEFQDTSSVQWDNFKVLIRDCIAHDSGSLIVGDVKQSIYRWRSGDWHLLKDLGEGHDKDLDPEMVGVTPLETNWRSEENVVCFNNIFFKLLAKVATEKMKRLYPDADGLTDICEIYHDVAQKVRPNRIGSHGGEVHITQIKINRNSENGEDEDTVMYEKVGQTLTNLLSKGVAQKDITLLVRDNRNIKKLATYFQQHPVRLTDHQGNPIGEIIPNMVSDEAFRLDASSVVCSLINAMRVLVFPMENLYREMLRKSWQVVRPECFTLPSDIENGDKALLRLSLTDMARRIYSLLYPSGQMDEQQMQSLEEQSAYVCTFFDKVQAFVRDNVADLEDLLHEWDDNLCSVSIQSSETDGIRLLTIHKSKGLESPNIIIPYCDWDIEKPNSQLWVKAQQKAPYKDLTLIPLDLSKTRLRLSDYRQDYDREHLMNIIDNLNLLYVAFTRARRRLYVFGKLVSDPEKSESLSALITQTLTELQQLDALPDNGADPDGEEYVRTQAQIDDDGETMTEFNFHLVPPTLTSDKTNSIKAGKTEEKVRQLAAATQTEPVQEINIFDPVISRHPISFTTGEVGASFRQSNDSQQFVTPEEEEDTLHRLEWVRSGNIVHALLAEIHTPDDLPAAIQRLNFNGTLYGQEMTHEKLQDYLNRLLTQPEASTWFTSDWTVINERSILIPLANGDVTEYRPDRVITQGKEELTLVIDFKTGDKQENQHIAQVQRYIRLLREMGYANVEGRIWYLRDTQQPIVDVE